MPKSVSTNDPSCRSFVEGELDDLLAPAYYLGLCARDPETGEAILIIPDSGAKSNEEQRSKDKEKEVADK